MAELPPRAAEYVLVLPDGKEYCIPTGRLTVGRQADCDLVIADPLVSRHHADLYVRGGTLYIQDLGSANGTIVNGGPMEGERSLSGGDVIEFGDTKVIVRVETPPVSIALRSITPEEAASGQVIGLDPPSAGYHATTDSIDAAPIHPPERLQTVPEQPPSVEQPPRAIVASSELVAEHPIKPEETWQPAPVALNPSSVQPKAPDEAPSSPTADSGFGTHETPAVAPSRPQPVALPPIAAVGDARLTIQASEPRAVPGGLAAEIALRGVLDIETADQFREAVTPLVQAQVIFFTIALDGVEYIDSSGLGALVGLHRQVKPRSGSVELERPQPAVRSVIELTRLDRVFKIV